MPLCTNWESNEVVISTRKTNNIELPREVHFKFYLYPNSKGIRQKKILGKGFSFMLQLMRKTNCKTFKHPKQSSHIKESEGT
jgi:hypothetical protein